MALTWFFSLGATKSPKLNLCTFLALKTTWKTILDNSRFLSLATKGWQISMDIIVEKFKISKILSFNGAMHLKWKLRTCTIKIEHEKIGFVSFFFNFFWFWPNARGMTTTAKGDGLIITNKKENWFMCIQSDSFLFWKKTTMSCFGEQGTFLVQCHHH